MKNLTNRLKSDYLMSSRLEKYDDFLCLTFKEGYTQTSIRDFWKVLHEDIVSDKKIVVHRHDIDSDIRTARKLFNIEKKHGVKSSYYFRISTLDFYFMHEIEEYGSEASYHYEEIATFAKRNNVRTADEILKLLPEIRNEFLNNFKYIEERLGKKLTTVASHGDFANRRLKLPNTEILNDQNLRNRCGIECESYDKTLLDNFDIYISDRPYPQYYYPISPFDSLGKYNKICFLTHPRQWETNWIENTKDNLFRLYEGLRW